MKQFSALLLKEWRENLRNYKIFWIPIVFILLGITEPLSNYYLPQILDATGGLPEGAVIELPDPEPEQLMVAVMGQFQLIGMLVLVLAYMGSIAGERRNGTATLLYVRPLSYVSYFLSKWLMASAVALLSVWAGFLAGYYYTAVLFSAVPFGEFLAFAATYSVWIVLVVTLVLFASASMPNGGLAAGLTLAALLILQLIHSLFGSQWDWSPFRLPNYAASFLDIGPDAVALAWTLALSLVCLLILATMGIWFAKRNRAKTKV
ncbi:ABC transporter permease subunit [Planococcus maritimus]|uniref:ABC transporter permease subunit n=1 Tax=Planococcus maritimus TaxID=192421 RepID=A0A7D7MFM3_PLAMR|nr:ABC transporter permease subunit [Planococcus maritimus]KYG59754.1 ABC transporter permease [Planococcus maritimus]OED33454.1 ABC transporter permease [Planococcus maritimus]QMT17090.1 ABC transporter permease subunit [Planococcus maritimus]